MSSILICFPNNIFFLHHINIINNHSDESVYFCILIHFHQKPQDLNFEID